MKLIKMARDGHEADVHPEMVDHYAAAGYSVVEEKPRRTRKKADSE